MLRPADAPVSPRFGAWLASCALGLALVLPGCGPSPKLSPLGPGSVVLAFGDSLTYGTGASEEESYPAQLAKLSGWRVIREGVPGEVSAAGLERLPAALDEHRPRLLLLCHGGNDFLQRLPKAQAAANLRAMVRLAQARGVEVALIGTPEPGFTVTPADFYAEIAKEFRLPYEDGVLGKILRDGSLKADAVHPNARGYRLMAERIYALLRKAGAG
jgi:lysophospholipase L1-like esterase